MGTTEPALARAAGVVFNRDEALTRVCGDEAFLLEVVAAFLERSRVLLVEIRQAVKGREGAALQTAAHELHGSAANLAAHAVGSAARVLEELGRSGGAEPWESALAALEGDFERLEVALAPAAAGGVHSPP